MDGIVNSPRKIGTSKLIKIDNPINVVQGVQDSTEAPEEQREKCMREIILLSNNYCSLRLQLAVQVFYAPVNYKSSKSGIEVV